MVIRNSLRLNKRLFGLVVMASFLILVLAISMIAYRVVSTPPKHPRILPPVQTSLQSIISSLRTSLPATYTYLYGVGPTAQTSVGYRAFGENFQVILPVMPFGIAFTDTNTSNEQTTYSDLSRVAMSMNAYLISHHFSAVTSQDQTNGLLEAVYFYQRADAVCQVTLYTELSLTCTPLTTLTNVVTQAKPLIALYEAAKPDSGRALISSPTIKESQTTGYTIARLPIYNNVGETDVNFYKYGSGTWQMVDLGWYNDPHENAGITPNCADFESNTQVRAAFAGQSCYDSATRTTGIIQ